jgi:RNA polymerase sigma-70 factor (ECF subfamily)
VLDVRIATDNDLAAAMKTAPNERVFEDAFSELMRRHKNAILSFLYRYTGDLKTAEDLTQEVFVRVFRKIKSFNASSRFVTWLYTIAGNLAKDEFKRRARRPAVPYDWQFVNDEGAAGLAPAVTQDPEGLAEKDERDAQVQTSLKQLRNDDREILILRELQGSKYDEIARILRMPIGTVKSRIARARNAFKDVWLRTVNRPAPRCAV